MKCSLLPVNRISKRKPLTEVYVNGIKEDRGAWEKAVQGQCAEVYVGPEETITKDGDRHFTEQGRSLKLPLTWSYKQGPK